MQFLDNEPRHAYHKHCRFLLSRSWNFPRFLPSIYRKLQRV